MVDKKIASAIADEKERAFAEAQAALDAAKDWAQAECDSVLDAAWSSYREVAAPLQAAAQAAIAACEAAHRLAIAPHAERYKAARAAAEAGLSKGYHDAIEAYKERVQAIEDHSPMQLREIAGHRA